MLLRSPLRLHTFLVRPVTTAANLLFPPSHRHHTATLQNLHILCTLGHLEQAFSLFYSLDLPPSQQTYATLFHACATHNSLRRGRALHHHMLTHNPNYHFNLHLTNHLLNMYAKCGDLDYAHQLFDEMPRRNIVSWTSLVSGYAQFGRANESFSLFASMLVHCHPNEFAYASVITSCGIECGRQVHALALKTSFDRYIYVANALINMYSNGCDYGVYDDDYKDEAWMVFRDMKFRNLVTWNSMIAGFSIRGLEDRAMGFFSLMHCEDVGFDRATLLSVLSSLCRNRNSSSRSDAALGLQCCFQLHCLVIKTGFLMEIGVATAIVKAYSDLGGAVDDCYNIFLETSGSRDIVSWTGIIATFAERDPERGFFLFCQLLQEGLAADSYAFSAVLKACAGLVTQRSALAVHSQVIKAGFEDYVVVANALIHAYARCSSIGSAKQVFDETEFQDTVSWNTMLKAYALHGQAKEAIKLFGEMNVHPDATTFVALLSACSHAGMVEEGSRIFDTMSEKYGIVPQLDHFACMVDILGRAGRVLEAEKIISEMPMVPDSVVWSAFLGACRKHGETNLANLAATKLKELDPENSLGYVLMSNIYCSAGIFTEAGLIRREMKGLGVQKEPGLSWIEVGSQVHEFASGGQKHPQGEAIRASLEQLVGRLKGLGYVPETRLVLQDVEEEQKEEQLYYHSEKLALVFALMNAVSLQCSRGVIQIVKNIRICVDCHNFMKVASGLVQKEIVVRDSNRFHHFKDRVCSCNDYW
ncbi:hypothetical protein CsSME_00034729 [Camellia sinensis var. sinensis]